MVDYNYENNKVDKLKGDIYISGRLSPDFTIQAGQAIMTSEDEHFRSFYFSGKIEKMDIRKMFGSLQQSQILNQSPERQRRENLEATSIMAIGIG